MCSNYDLTWVATHHLVDLDLEMETIKLERKFMKTIEIENWELGDIKRVVYKDSEMSSQSKILDKTLISVQSKED